MKNFYKLFVRIIFDKYFDMDKQRLYENIMCDLRDVFPLHLNEDVLDDLDRIGGGKTSVEKILDMSPIVVRQGGKYIEMQLSDDENKNEIMRLVGDRFGYVTGDPDIILSVDDFLFLDEDGEYKMYLWIDVNDLMKRRWGKGRIFADAVTKDLKTPKWICFSKGEKYDKWYAVCREPDENGTRYRILNIRQ